jgi:hypothetical protein
MGFPLLQKPGDMCVGRQIKVLGSYWKERMSNEKENSLYYVTCALCAFIMQTSVSGLSVSRMVYSTSLR